MKGKPTAMQFMNSNIIEGQTNDLLPVKSSFPVQRVLCLIIVTLTAGLILSGCGSGSSSGSKNPTAEPLMNMGQALLGPLVNAQVEVYPLSGSGVVPIHATTTTDSAVLDEAGIFTLPSELIDGDELYIIKVTGGEDIDADDDGVLDALPTINRGTVHAVFTAEQILAGGYRVTVLSEVVYRQLWYLLASKATRAEIFAAMNRIAATLLIADVDGDSDRDSDDIAVWNPRADGAALRDGMAPYTAIAAGIHNDHDVTAAALDLAKPETGSVDTPGSAYDVAVASGGLAYVADSFAGLHVLDVSDPSHPIIIGTVATTDARGVAINAAGTNVVVADNAGGIQVVDVSNPSLPRIVGSLPGADGAVDVKIVGNYAYVAEQDSQFEIIDISDPANPAIVGTAAMLGWSNAVDVAGNYAYVADYFEGLQVVDISDPSNPSIVANFPANGPEVHDVVVDGNYAYVADGTYGMEVVDISDPLNPVQAGEFGAPNEYVSLAKSGNLLFVVDAILSVEVIDVSDPAAPVSAGVMSQSDAMEGITIFGNLLFTTAWSSGVNIYPAIAPGLPLMLGSTWTLPNVPWGGMTSIDNPILIGNLLYSTRLASGLDIYDVSNVSNPTLIGNVDPGSIEQDLYIVGNTAYLAGYASGLNIIDISNPAAPVVINSLTTVKANNVIIAGNYAYVFDANTYVIKIFDVSDPLNVVESGSFSLEMANVYDWKISGNYLYVATGSAKALKVVDISDPLNPVIVNTLTSSGNFRGMDIAGSLLYLTMTGEQGLRVEDISDPANPTTVSTLPVGTAVDVSVAGNTAYISTDDGVLIVDVSDTANPVIRGSISVRDSAWEVIATNDVIFICDSLMGLQISPVPQQVLP